MSPSSCYVSMYVPSFFSIPCLCKSVRYEDLHSGYRNATNPEIKISIPIATECRTAMLAAHDQRDMDRQRALA